jgi:hypothetical protein
LRYELALNINTGDIVWAFGGYPCGEFPDLKLAREMYIEMVDDNEMTMADNGYKDADYFIYPDVCNAEREHKRIMSRHETVNGRIKNFNVLSHVFRHDKNKHSLCFHAVVNIVQISIDYGERLYRL